jgi:hypothetical protein
LAKADGQEIPGRANGHTARCVADALSARGIEIRGANAGIKSDCVENGGGIGRTGGVLVEKQCHAVKIGIAGRGD